jgi:hypothetical protein
MDQTLKGISVAAREVPCAEGTLRAMDGVLNPIRDSAGRRLYTQANIEAARAHLARSLAKARRA